MAVLIYCSTRGSFRRFFAFPARKPVKLHGFSKGGGKKRKNSAAALVVVVSTTRVTYIVLHTLIRIQVDARNESAPLPLPLTKCLKSSSSSRILVRYAILLQAFINALGRVFHPTGSLTLNKRRGLAFENFLARLRKDRKNIFWLVGPLTTVARPLVIEGFSSSSCCCSSFSSSSSERAQGGTHMQIKT